ncbi:MAG: hypothetical protein KC684_08370 [Candidatus Omnitrophica bacterium]|nr:hypothetical protein [Candidatus Omnitrophota bacterium]
MKHWFLFFSILFMCLGCGGQEGEDTAQEGNSEGGVSSAITALFMPSEAENKQAEETRQKTEELQQQQEEMQQDRLKSY